MPAKRPRHSWLGYLRFSLRSLIIAVLLLGGGLAWIVRTAQIQRAAVTGIIGRRELAVICYDWQCKDGVPIANARLWWPKWLVHKIGVDYFGNVSYVWCSGSDAQLGLLPIFWST